MARQQSEGMLERGKRVQVPPIMMAAGRFRR
jgi:hypothetical protein